jgi:hypothetical protein
MYLVAITRSNCNAFLVLKFLTSIVEVRATIGTCLSCVCVVLQVFESFFGTLDEDSLRNNFVVIYELLDGATAAHPVRHSVDISAVAVQK